MRTKSGRADFSFTLAIRNSGFFELLVPDLLAAGLYTPVSRWIFQYFQEQYQFDAAGSTEALRLLQPVLALYYIVSLLYLSARCG